MVDFFEKESHFLVTCLECRHIRWRQQPTIGELADLFEYLEFQIKDSRTGQLSSPFYISIKARGAKADEDLDDFTLQGLLDAINDLEWIVSRHKRKSRGKLSLIFCRKVGVD